MNSITIIDYQPRWVDEFHEIKADLQWLLGNLAVDIDHIGSTAIVGLAAKDIIDVQVSVKALDTPLLVAAFQKGGYVYRGDITHDNLVGYQDQGKEMQKLYFREPKGARQAHIHVREVGRVNQLYALLFRDFLRKNEAIAMAYEKIKRSLAKRFPNDIDAYYEIKDPYMDTLFCAASLLEAKSKT
ncbi:GrpB family protein [Pseudoalteromonas umbrosa]|uniref:GrpB family protein n=1 Tax=Pseudoalteromonas umbrosa TaxID=3048489 RepID=UPI0024C257FA|nr:GrpB family protein [Pseudoalteromonas sp. B95]MDK1288157.1 GrpB family protein [Pseudoalteromonas sp. B95]